MWGPGVAPLARCKQNLAVHVLRRLQRHFFVVNQFFRLDSCSHDIEQETASMSFQLIIAMHAETNNVWLEHGFNNLSLKEDVIGRTIRIKPGSCAVI